MWISIGFFVIALLNAYVVFRLLQNSAPDDIKTTETSQKVSRERISVPKVDTEGVIIVSDAAQGFARESVIRLAERGFHVLACVKSKREALSYAYESAKGIETFVADLAKEPNDLAKLLYRVKELKRDLNRDLVALVYNNVDTYESETNKLGSHLSTINLEESYRATLKSPFRVVEAVTQFIHEYNEKNCDKSKNLCDVKGRIVIVNPRDRSRQGDRCNMMCILSRSLDTFYQELSKSYLTQSKNVFLTSVVDLDDDSDSHSNRMDKSMKDVYDRILGDNEVRQIKYRNTLAVMHAMLSDLPLMQYTETLDSKH